MSNFVMEGQAALDDQCVLLAKHVGFETQMLVQTVNHHSIQDINLCSVPHASTIIILAGAGSGD